MTHQRPHRRRSKLGSMFKAGRKLTWRERKDYVVFEMDDKQSHIKVLKHGLDYDDAMQEALKLNRLDKYGHGLGVFIVDESGLPVPKSDFNSDIVPIKPYYTKVNSGYLQGQTVKVIGYHRLFSGKRIVETKDGSRVLKLVSALG